VTHNKSQQQAKRPKFVGQREVLNFNDRIDSPESPEKKAKLNFDEVKLNIEWVNMSKVFVWGLSNQQASTHLNPSTNIYINEDCRDLAHVHLPAARLDLLRRVGKVEEEWLTWDREAQIKERLNFNQIDKQPKSIAEPSAGSLLHTPRDPPHTTNATHLTPEHMGRIASRRYAVKASF
jgi:hypothetical protein